MPPRQVPFTGSIDESADTTRASVTRPRCWTAPSIGQQPPVEPSTEQSMWSCLTSWQVRRRRSPHTRRRPCPQVKNASRPDHREVPVQAATSTTAAARNSPARFLGGDPVRSRNATARDATVGPVTTGTVLERRAASVPAARAYVRKALSAWGQETQTVDDAALLVTEPRRQRGTARWRKLDRCPPHLLRRSPALPGPR
jgi:hypothetical protein